MYFRRAGSRWGIEGALIGYGNTLIAMKEYEMARECLKESYEIAIYLNDRYGSATIIESLAFLSLEAGNEIDAGKLLNTAKKIRDELKTPMSLVNKSMFGKSFDELMSDDREILSIEAAIKIGLEMKIK